MAKRKVPKRRRRRRRAAPRRPPAPGAEETRLLQLASELSALARGPRPPAAAMDAALQRLGGDGPAPARGGDKTRVLALAWAREQARLALADVLERAAKAGAVRTDVAADTLAWLVLAAAEALGREPADAAPDRLHAIAAFIRPPGAR